jgi:chromosome partitioning protein
MAHVISVINQKGGTAKTTSAVCIASRFAQRGKRTLLIDADPQGNAGQSLGVDGFTLERTLYDVLVHDVPLREIIVATSQDKLHVAPSQVSLSKTDINLADVDGNQFRLKEALEDVRGRYDYIIIDCQPSFGLIPVNALVASAGCIVPMVPQYFALEGLRQINASLDRIKQELNPNLELYGIVFCVVDRRINLTTQAMEMVEEHYKEQVFKSRIHLCSKLHETVLTGESIFLYAPECRGAKEYSALVDEIAERTEPPSFVSQFFNRINRS